jgi:ribosomal protein S7
MPKKEVLDFNPAPRPEQVDDKRPKQMEDRKHRLGGCADSASPRESVRMRFLGTTGQSWSINCRPRRDRELGLKFETTTFERRVAFGIPAMSES